MEFSRSFALDLMRSFFISFYCIARIAMTEIRLSANGGAPQIFDSGVEAATALKALLSNKERKNTVAVCLGERLLDLSTRLTADGDLQTVAVDSPAGLDILRHSAAHIMAQAVLDIFGKTVKVAIGPSIADGFYYDFDRGEPFTPEDLEKIEQRMSEIVQQAKTFRAQHDFGSRGGAAVRRYGATL